MSDITANQAPIRSYLTSNKLTVAGTVLSALLILLALISPLIVPHDPLDQSFINEGQWPSAHSWIGTDS
ncbi:MAG: hypothetical protein JWQ55_476, partial [Rhodopila sp.]|nr:hypothetical protein [Rhodopila sp.]